DRQPRQPRRRRDPRLHAPRREGPRADDRHGHPRPGGGELRRPRHLPRRRQDRRRDARADGGARPRPHEALRGLTMFRVALKGVMARKGRILLTSIAIIAGTAFLAGVFVLTNTIQKSFDVLSTDAYAKTDAWVRSSHEIDAGFQFKQRDRIPDSLIAE